MSEIKAVEQEIEEIDGMETNIEDSFNDDPLSDVFDNEQNLEGTEEEPEKKVEPEPVEEKVEESSEENKVESPEDAMKKITGLNQALAEEREKKRQAQQRVYDLTHGNQQQQEQKKEEFDWKDPNKTIESVETRIESNMLAREIKKSANKCREDHPEDAVEYLTLFDTLRKANPGLDAELVNQFHPAEWAYNYAKKHKEMQEIGNDPAAYKEKMKAELKAELLAEFKNDNNGKIGKLIEKTPLPPGANSFKGKIVDQKSPVILDDPLGSIEAGNR